jgi:hypothetical protein
MSVLQVGTIQMLIPGWLTALASSSSSLQLQGGASIIHNFKEQDVLWGSSSQIQVILAQVTNHFL